MADQTKQSILSGQGNTQIIGPLQFRAKPTEGGDEDAALGGGRRLPIYRLAGEIVCLVTR